MYENIHTSALKIDLCDILNDIFHSSSVTTFIQYLRSRQFSSTWKSDNRECLRWDFYEMVNRMVYRYIELLAYHFLLSKPQQYKMKMYVYNWYVAHKASFQLGIYIVFQLGHYVVKSLRKIVNFYYLLYCFNFLNTFINFCLMELVSLKCIISPSTLHIWICELHISNKSFLIIPHEIFIEEMFNYEKWKLYIENHLKSSISEISIHVCFISY